MPSRLQCAAKPPPRPRRRKPTRPRSWPWWALVGLVVQPLPVRQAEERLFLIVFKDEPKSSQDAGAGAAQVRHVLEDASRLQRLQTANELSTVLA